MSNVVISLSDKDMWSTTGSISYFIVNFIQGEHTISCGMFSRKPTMYSEFDGLENFTLPENPGTFSFAGHTFTASFQNSTFSCLISKDSSTFTIFSKRGYTEIAEPRITLIINLRYRLLKSKSEIGERG